MRLGIDVGSAFVKVAVVGPDGVAAPLGHAKSVAGHGFAPGALPDDLGITEAVITTAANGPISTSVVRALGPAVPYRVVPSSVAVAAWARHAAGVTDGLLVVADLGAAGCRIDVCRVEGGLVAQIRDIGRADEHAFGTAYDRTVLTAANSDDLESLRQLRTSLSADDLRRTVAFAQERPRFAEAPLFRSGPFTVAAALAAYEPLGSRAGELLRAVLARLDEPAHLIVTGGMAAFPLACDELCRGADKVIAAPDPAYVAAYGAALIAAGTVTAGDRLPYPVTVRARRIEGGRLISADVPLDGVPDAGGEVRYAMSGADRPAFALADLAADQPVLDMGPAGITWSVADLSGLPAEGSFHVGMRLRSARPELVLFRAGGGPASHHRLTVHSNAAGETR